MSTRSNSPTPAELANEASAWLVAGGIITVALFLLAVPALALLAICLVALLIPGLAAGVLVAGFALPVLLVRSVARRALRALRPGERLGQGHPISH